MKVEFALYSCRKAIMARLVRAKQLRLVSYTEAIKEKGA